MNPNTPFQNKTTLKKAIIDKLMTQFGKNLEDAGPELIYQASALVVKDELLHRMAATNKKDKEDASKKVYYISMEFLMGRSLANNILNLMQSDNFKKVLGELGVYIDEIIQIEPDAGLGNGGLGRLAACFLDSLTTLEYPAIGCTIRYEYGLFKQIIKDGKQEEIPDWWLENGNIWEVKRIDEKIQVSFGGEIENIWVNGKLKVIHHNPRIINAIPYDFPVSGYKSKRVNYLRLWQAQSMERLNMAKFNKGLYLESIVDREDDELVSKVLYPEDNNPEGKKLRLKQEYFLSSATIQWIIKEFKKKYGSDFAKLPDKVVIHINDTHPTLAIPEMMRILLDEEELEWDETWDIVTNTFAFTNHTVMSEALESWPIYLLQPLLPRIFSIIKEINQRLMEKLNRIYPNDRQKHEYMAILSNDHVNMPNLCLATCFAINGVSSLHSQILINDLFADYARIKPEKFMGITNGITFRRWIDHCNPQLSSLITSKIGNDWLINYKELEKLKPYANDPDFRREFKFIRQKNKRKLAAYIKEHNNIEVDLDSMFIVQAKRLHEYKRQLLNGLHILYLYNRIIENPDKAFTPRTFIFAAKAAPGYTRAKNIIELINAIAKLVNNDPRVNDKLKVVFLENYNVSIAEMLIPAADLSEQISTAGKEASGTGNMKFMLNGALTIGSYDGANVEMTKEVGEENIYIFGLRAEEVKERYKYSSNEVKELYISDYELHQVLEQLLHGPLVENNQNAFRDIYQSLLFGDYGIPDPYMVIRDFRPYVEMQRKVAMDYLDEDLWWRKAVLNTACAGFFSSDRTIETYNELIWHLEKTKW